MNGGIVWINGLFGSGKTTAAITLQRTRECAIFDAEDVGTIVARIARQAGRCADDFQHFRAWRKIVPVAAVAMANECAPVPVVMPMTVGVPEYRSEIRRALRESGIRYVEVYLACDVGECERRLVRREGRRGDWAVRRNSELISPFENDQEAETLDVRSIDPSAVADAIWQLWSRPLPWRSGRTRTLTGGSYMPHTSTDDGPSLRWN